MSIIELNKLLNMVRSIVLGNTGKCQYLQKEA